MKFRFRRSAPARFLALYLAVTICGTVPLLLFIYNETGRTVTNLYGEQIDEHKNSLLKEYAAGQVAGLSRAISEDIADGTAAHAAMLLVDPAGQRVAGNISDWPPTLRTPTRWTEMWLYRDGHANPELFAISNIRLSTGHKLLIGTRIEDRERMQEALVAALFAALLLTIPIGLGGGFVMLAAINRRVEQIGNVAARIAAGDLGHRLEQSASEDDAFSRLSAAINRMLARIEELVAQLRLVTDALAHDLRSPLMRIRAANERLATYDLDDGGHQAVEAMSAQIDIMLRLISATLDISRTEAGIGRDDFTMFPLDSMVRDLCEIYTPVAEERGASVTLSEAPNVKYFGHRELLGQAVANLIDNALKYAGGAPIALALNNGGKEVAILVADGGPGIPDHRRDEAMAKYRRLEGARTDEGSGLGLAFVRAVARLHGGDLMLEDNGPGLRAIIRLPQQNHQGGNHSATTEA